MNSDATGILIARIGALSQLGSLVLITLFVGALARSRPDRVYFAHWALAWAGYVVSLGAIVVRFSPLKVDGIPLTHLGESTPVVFAINVVYNAGKLGFLAGLLAGTHRFVHPGRNPIRHAVWIAVGLLVASAGLVAASRTLDRAMIVQSVIAVPIFAACTALLAARPLKDHSFGTTLLGAAFGAHAVLWTLYGSAFVLAGRSPEANPLQPLLSYNSYVDAVIQTLLAYGMVLVVMEQATRESQLAHAELEVAHHALRKAAYTDPLSGARNRQAFAEGIGLEAIGEGTATIAVLDVDNLKAVNDSLGHDAGDALIRHFASAVLAALRPAESLYRWGGDEFLAVLPGTGVTEAEQRLDAALAAVASVAVAGVLVPVRASAGYVPVHAGDLAGTIRRADRAMYEVKARRRAITLATVSGAPAKA